MYQFISFTLCMILINILSILSEE